MSNYGKTKTAGKLVVTRGKNLQAKVLETMRNISDSVGATLGPGGLPVIIERSEEGLPNIITKDGVTVFKHLGYEDSISHCIMEAARDAAVRTADQAGDGTTTATVLSEAIVRNLTKYCENHPKVSPQKVVRRLESVFKEIIQPTINGLSKKLDFNTSEGQDLLHSVATISANGDTELADAVMTCFELVGDEGNVTITEQSGPSNYEVERIHGFPIGSGYEESCARYFQLFINDAAAQRTYLEKPIFVIYHGVVSEMQTIIKTMEMIGQAWQESDYNHNVVLVATGFSDNVLGQLALNFQRPDTINVVPLVAPKSVIQTGQLDFMEDLAAVTGTYVFNPITRPLDHSSTDDFGTGVQWFECNRSKSLVVGRANEEQLIKRVEALQSLVGKEDSILEKDTLQYRIGRLTGGIAKLKVIGSSSGELREKKDRAEDAVCAVRGAIKYGCLPGCGWTLLKLCNILSGSDDYIIDQILIPSLKTPVQLLLANAGLSKEEISYVMEKMELYIKQGEKLVTYDAINMMHVDPFKSGILDSTPAVLEAIRNSISIASLLGTLGGAIVFPRDKELEREESHRQTAFKRALEEGNKMASEE